LRPPPAPIIESSQQLTWIKDLLLHDDTAGNWYVSALELILMRILGAAAST
jgi:hypothetical protein